MKHFYLAYLALLVSIVSFSQTDSERSELENRKKRFELELRSLTDSIDRLSLEIAQLKSRESNAEISGLTPTATVKLGAKLRREPHVFADIVALCKEGEEVVILNYVDDYFEICQDSVCGYVNEVWIVKNESVYDLMRNLEEGRRLRIADEPNEMLPSRKFSPKIIESSQNRNTKKKRRRFSRTYHRGPRGGCYYINKNGNKSYVDRSLCN